MILTRVTTLALLLACATAVPIAQKNVHTHTPHPASDWKNRVIYQIFTDRFASSSGGDCSNLADYCGGTWKAAIDQLDYVKELGATALWISPVVENTDGGYHGYWLKDLYEVNSHFGTKDDLKQFVDEAHKRDIWVMVDVVANHVGNVDMDFADITPFNQSSHYHSKCQITDYNNQPQVEVCRLADLPDLDQNNPFVRETLKDWIHNLVIEYGFDGVRVDTVPEVHPDFWDEFNTAANSFCLGEVFNGRLDYVSSYQQHMDGILGYPLFFAMRNCFMNTAGSMQAELEPLVGPSGSILTDFKNPSLLGNFIDNHDNPRFLSSQADTHMYMNAVTFTLMAEGIPIVYYGQEQGFSGGADPENREVMWGHYDTTSDLFKFHKTLLDYRNSLDLASEPMVQRYAADNFYAFSRGDTLVATTNGGTGFDISIDVTYLPDSYKAGVSVCNVWDTADCNIVQDGPKLTVNLSDGLPKVFQIKK